MPAKTVQPARAKRESHLLSFLGHQTVWARRNLPSGVASSGDLNSGDAIQLPAEMPGTLELCMLESSSGLQIDGTWRIHVVRGA